MFSNVASVLGYQRQPKSTNIDRDHTSSRPRLQVSCEGYGWTLPRTDIRLRVSSNNSSVVRIFGFPPQEDFPKSMWYPPQELGRDGPYIHYLLGESPASVKYVMGDNWRSRLQKDPEGLSTGARKGDFILRPSVTSSDTQDSYSGPEDDLAVFAEERALSLRMRRCGAVAICAHSDIGLYDAEQMKMVPKYLFGWPESGGVWVVRPPCSDSAPEESANKHRTDAEVMKDMMKMAQREDVYFALAAKVPRQESMEDVCQILQEAGARFNAAIEDSPEAVELNLC